MTIRTLIVDDEPLGVLGVRTLLTQEADVDLVGECLEGMLAPEMIRRLRPDLLFLDVQMPGLDGFGVLQALERDELPLVVFVTAYDRYSIQAFEVHALDYVLKPLNRERFRQTMARARQSISQRIQSEISARLLAFLDASEGRRKGNDKFVIRDGDRVFFLNPTEIEAVQSTGNYMHLYRGRESFLLRETLAHLEERMDPSMFARTHRSWVVNLNKIKEIKIIGECEYMLRLEGGLEVPVSRRYRHRFVEILKRPLMGAKI